MLYFIWLFPNKMNGFETLVLVIWREFFLGWTLNELFSAAEQQGAAKHHWMIVGLVRNRTQPPSSCSLELNRTPSCCLATLSASMEIDVREIKGNSEIQTSASLDWDRAGGKLARCVVNVSQSTEYYPPTVLQQKAVRAQLCFETNNATLKVSYKVLE